MSGQFLVIGRILKTGQNNPAGNERYEWVKTGLFSHCRYVLSVCLYKLAGIAAIAIYRRRLVHGTFLQTQNTGKSQQNCRQDMRYRAHDCKKILISGREILDILEISKFL